MTKYLVFYLEAFFLLVIPVALLTYSAQFLAIRHIFMGVAGIYCVLRLAHTRLTLSDLGFRRLHFIESLKSIALPSLRLVLATFLIFYLLPHPLLANIVGYDSLAIGTLKQRLVAYIFLSSPVQELIFRGYLTWRLKQVFRDSRVVDSLSVAIFTFVHLPFHSPLILVVTCLMGIIYIKNYQKYQNIYAPIISHSIVGALLIIIRNAWFPFP